MEYVFGKKNPKVLDRVAEEESNSSKDAETEARYLSLKSGYITLKERMKSLTDQSRTRTRSMPTDDSIKTNDSKQFANLQELFSSRNKKSCHKVYCNCDECAHQKRPKIPVMKLSKEDWNVKCWEERLRKRQAGDKSGQVEGINRLKKPEQQVEAFQGRVESVALKLDKVREGVPLDEKLFQLSTNRIYESKSSQTWTSMLKDELAKGTHNREKLRSECSNIGISNEGVRKSPLGRPIKKMFEDDENDDVS